MILLENHLGRPDFQGKQLLGGQNISLCPSNAVKFEQVSQEYWKEFEVKNQIAFSSRDQHD